MVSVPIGGAVDLPVRLTTTCDHEIAISINAIAPDERVTIAGLSASFPPKSTDALTLHITANGESTPACKTVYSLTALGLPEVRVRVKLEQPKH